MLVMILVLPGVSALAQTSQPAPAPTTQPATRPAMLTSPKDLAELKAFERVVEEVVARVSPAVVGIFNGSSAGSGVIVSADGYILTAGHVAADAGRTVDIRLTDGRKLKAKTLGINHDIDSGLMKITDEGPFPYSPIGSSNELKSGQWTIALGHPGGFDPKRPPVVRIGRFLRINNRFLQTDCILIGGDSGGPLFDLEGRVIGIHSRIGTSVENNMDVPVDTYLETWTRLASSEVWGGNALMARARNGPVLGVSGEDADQGFRVSALTPNSPAEESGVQPGDIIMKINETTIRNTNSLMFTLARHQPGDEVNLKILRGTETLVLKAKLASRSNP